MQNKVCLNTVRAMAAKESAAVALKVFKKAEALKQWMGGEARAHFMGHEILNVSGAFMTLQIEDTICTFPLALPE